MKRKAPFFFHFDSHRKGSGQKGTIAAGIPQQCRHQGILLHLKPVGCKRRRERVIVWFSHSVFSQFSVFSQWLRCAFAVFSRCMDLKDIQICGKYLFHRHSRKRKDEERKSRADSTEKEGEKKAKATENPENQWQASRRSFSSLSLPVLGGLQ